MKGIGLVGFGYWGPNLARNFAIQEGVRLAAICEQQPKRAAAAKQLYPSAHVTADYNELLNDPDIHAILIATPVSHHYPLAKQALLAGKDILVEKPFTQTYEEALELMELGESLGRIIAVDHTFLFTGAVKKIKELVDSKVLGDILYFDSVRINLGLFQKDVNVIHDLAPHDLAILSHLVDTPPVSVQAMGACHGGACMESVAYLHLEYETGMVAHFHFNWLAPVKVRKTLIAGTNKMVVWDDLEASEKVKVYDKGVLISNDPDSINKVKVDYRTGDMWAPKLLHQEALGVEARHFVDCIVGRTRPLAGASEGAQVVRILEASKESLANGGRRVAL